MAIAQQVSVFSVRYLLQQAARASGYELTQAGVEPVTQALRRYFAEPAPDVVAAIKQANQKAWDSLDFSLSEVGFLRRLFISRPRKDFRDRVRQLVDQTPPSEAHPDMGQGFRERCLRELRAARNRELLSGGEVSLPKVGEDVGQLLTHSNPARLYDAERKVATNASRELEQAGFPALAFLLSLQLPGEGSVLSATIEHYFKTEVPADKPVFQAGLLNEIRDASAAQDRRMDSKAEEPERILPAWDLRVEGQRRRSQQALYDGTHRLLQELGLYRKELLPRHAGSAKTPEQRRQIRELFQQFRERSVQEQRGMPALLNDLGRLLYAAGEHQRAGQVFRELVKLVSEGVARAEPYFNAYRNALVERDWKTALENLVLAVYFDPSRQPFPVYRYEPELILGASEFSVTFRCRDKALHQQVVLEAPITAGLGRGLRSYVREAQALVNFEHPAVIRMRSLELAEPETKQRPFLVREYFRGQDLDEHVRTAGVLPEKDVLEIATPVAEALKEIHLRDLYHLDLRPANVLLRHDDKGWTVRLVNFDTRSQVLQGGAARLGPQADVQGFGRLCNFALFGTTAPAPNLRQKRKISSGLQELIDACTQEDAGKRPKGFAEIHDRLHKLRVALTRVPATSAAEAADLVRVGEETGTAAPATGTSGVSQGAGVVPDGGWAALTGDGAVLSLEAELIPESSLAPVPPVLRPREQVVRTLWKLFPPQVHGKVAAPVRGKEARRAVRLGPGKDLLAEMVVVQGPGGRPFLVHPHPFLFMPERCQSHLYPVPRERTTLTLQEWLERHDGPPDWAAARRLLAAYGLRLPTSAQLRAALAAKAVPRMPSAAFVRDDRLRFFLPSGEVGFPDLVPYHPGKDRHRRVLIVVSEQFQPAAGGAPVAAPESAPPVQG
jgi:serine/threonine protein kinase